MGGLEVVCNSIERHPTKVVLFILEKSDPILDLSGRIHNRIFETFNDQFGSIAARDEVQGDVDIREARQVLVVAAREKVVVVDGESKPLPLLVCVPALLPLSSMC